MPEAVRLIARAPIDDVTEKELKPLLANPEEIKHIFSSRLSVVNEDLMKAGPLPTRLDVVTACRNPRINGYTSNPADFLFSSK